MTDADTITVPTCSSLAAFSATGVPTISEWSLLLLALVLGTSGFVAMRKR